MSVDQQTILHTPAPIDPGARRLGWAMPARKPWSHFVVLSADGLPYELCRGPLAYYFGPHDPSGTKTPRKCGDCERILRELDGEAI